MIDQGYSDAEIEVKLAEARKVGSRSSGAATGYSTPPIFPRNRCPSGISSISFAGIRSPRSNPVMVLP